MEENTQMHEQITVSSLFNKNDTRKKFTVIGLSLIAFLVLATVIIKILVNLIPDLRIFFTSIDFNLEILIDYGMLYGIGFLLFFLVIRNIPKDNIPKQKFSFGRLILIFFMVYPLATAGSLIGNAIESLISPGNTTSSNIMDFAANGSALSIFVMVIAAPFVEEMVFRKMIIDRTKRYGEKTAILFSALCFGFYHMTISQFIYATCIGCLFGYVYSRSGKIHYTMIMHGVINALSCILSLSASKYMELFASFDMTDPDSAANINISEIMGSITPSHIIAMVVTLLIIMLEFAMIILGIIFLCIKAKNVRFVETSPYCIPKGQKFKTIGLSWGVILFAVMCITLTFINLLL